MYEAVQASPGGDTPVARLVETASEYGYDGVVVRNHGDEPPEYDRSAVEDRYGGDVVDGVEVRADDPSRASGFVGNYRDSKTVVAVHGGSTAINRFAVEQPAVDVLAHPMAGDGDVNHVLAKEAAENGVRLEFSFGGVLRADGGERVQALRGLRKLRELVFEYDVPYVVSGGPTSHLELRAPRELTAVADVAGFEPETVTEGLREWGRLAERNRLRTSEAFVEPGVYRGTRLPGDRGSEDREDRD
jgi:ribonuclease P/MRP protein subunit RPP1